jgi:hypothetical protein
VTILNGTGDGAAPRLGRTSVDLANTSALRNAPNRSAQFIGELRNRASTSASRSGVGVELTGDFGTSQPTLSAFEVRGASVAYGTGDVFVVRFDRDTDRGGVRGGKQYVDSLFEFTQPIGADYSGEWSDESTFRVEVGRAPTRTPNPEPRTPNPEPRAPSPEPRARARAPSLTLTLTRNPVPSPSPSPKPAPNQVLRAGFTTAPCGVHPAPPCVPVSQQTQARPAGRVYNPARTTQRASASVAIHPSTRTSNPNPSSDPYP